MIKFKSTQQQFQYFLICLGCFTMSFNVAAIAAALPEIAIDLDISDLQVAKIIPFYLIPYGLGALLYAPLTKYFSYHRVLCMTMFGYALSCLLCGLSNSLNIIILGRILMGVTGAAAIPLGLMIIGEFYEKEIRGRLVGAFFGMSFVASLLGIVTFGVMNWRWVFMVPAFVGTALAIMLALFPTEEIRKKHIGNINYVQSFSNPAILKVFLFIFAISFLYHGVHKWYGIYFSQEYGLNKVMISGFFVLSLVGGLIGQLSGGIISDLKGRKSACYIGIFGLGFATMILLGHYPLYILGVTILLISMFWTIGHNGISTVLTDFPDADRPTIASLNSSIRFISGGLGFQISSYFVSTSFGLTFFIIGILILLLAVILKHVIP